MKRDNKHVLRFTFCYTIAHLVPVLGGTKALNQFMWYSVKLDSLTLLLLILGLFSVLIVEACALCIVLNVLRHSASPVQTTLLTTLRRKASMLVFAGALTGFHILLLLSWSSFFIKGSLLGTLDLANLYFLLDLKQLVYWTTPADMGRFAAVLIGAGALSALIILVTPRISTVTASWRLPGYLCSALLMGIVCFAIVRFLPSEGSARRSIFLISRVLNPRLAFCSSWITGIDLLHYERAELTLTPIDSISRYQGVPSAGEPKARRNIIMIIVEALRADVLDATRRDPPTTVMPVTEAMAQSGLAFSRAYAQAPETTYSQATLLTGLYPLKFPLRDMNFDLAYPYVRIYDLLKLAGYRTAYLTEETVAMKRLSASPSLDLYFDPQYGSNEKITHGALDSPITYEVDDPALISFDRQKKESLLDFIDQSAHDSMPFFSIIYFSASHFPYNLPERLSPPFKPHELAGDLSFLSFTEQQKEVLRNRYYNTLWFIDSLIGEISSALRRLEIDDTTVLIITGDHGQFFLEHGEVTHGTRLYEEVLHVPLIISGGAALAPRCDLAMPTGHIDVAPTILELAGLPEHHGFQGVSIIRAPGSANPEICQTSIYPIFSTAQAGSFEDSVLLYPFRYTRNQFELSERLFDLAVDPTEAHDLTSKSPHLRDFLSQVLESYRSRQLSYFSLPAQQRQAFFPPQHAPIPIPLLTDHLTRDGL